MLDETMPREIMPLHATNKINNKLKFIYRKQNTFSVLKGLLCNGRIQPHFDCAFYARYLNLTKKIEKQNPDFSEQKLRFLSTVK